MPYVFQTNEKPDFTAKWSVSPSVLLKQDFDFISLVKVSNAILLSSNSSDAINLSKAASQAIPQLDLDPLLEKNTTTYQFSHSHYFNWDKNLQVNLLNSENFTHYFIRMKKNDPAHFQQAEKLLQLIGMISFLEQLDDHDTYVLFFAGWAHYFNQQDTQQAKDYLENFLTNYTIQKDDLKGLNQLTASLNQVMLQHFPKVRRQDLRLIYRLIELIHADQNTIQEVLSTLNETARARTSRTLSYLQDALRLAEFSNDVLNTLENPISFKLLKISAN